LAPSTDLNGFEWPWIGWIGGFNAGYFLEVVAKEETDELGK
jgi:hypothetical protein